MNPSTHLLEDAAQPREPQSTLPASSFALPLQGELLAAAERAGARIAPTWPLDRFIAVNPFWELTSAPIEQVAAELGALSGAALLMPRAWYRAAYQAGRLRDEHLIAALRSSGSTLPLSALHATLETDDVAPPTRALLVDVADDGQNLELKPSWKAFVTQNVSQLCASYFDEGQATYRFGASDDLYTTWRRHALSDRGPALLMGATRYTELVAQLPETASELLPFALAALQVPRADYEHYFWALLLEQNGWASWCAYQRWNERLGLSAGHVRGGEGSTALLTQLLAIRLAWEWTLLRLNGPSVARRWVTAKQSWATIERAWSAFRANDWLLQRAMEIAWRQPVVKALPKGLPVARPTHAAVQAVFCIDVRSEVFRRALEGAAPGLQTLGFAGFFGLPVEYLPLGASEARPQLPGLLAPRLRVVDAQAGGPKESERRGRIADSARWRAFRTDALASFTFVESFGPSYVAKLFRELVGQRASAHELSPLSPTLFDKAAGQPLGRMGRADLAHGMLRGMSLTRNFARLVLLVGHGSTTRNNPHAAGLDCGACCGQTGQVNARVAAALLNDPLVRSDLAQRGIEIPGGTRFVAALHDTTSDDVELFDLEQLPASHADDLGQLRAWLAEAGHRARRERAERLGITETTREGIDRAVRARTMDWAQVRPEWGLANNAAFVIAPREHCRHLNLEGRSFLHEYRHLEDPSYATLELIMTAPVLVTHWINFQYYASTVDNQRYGSGNKVLHNVVGGHIGVFEGNAGDLRIGLPLQSLHDGERFVHSPLRLSVFIEAPRDAIDAILAKHSKVRDLVQNGWLALLQLDEREAAVYERTNSGWERLGDASGQPFELSAGAS